MLVAEILGAVLIISSLKVQSETRKGSATARRAVGGVEYLPPREGNTLGLLPWEGGKCGHVTLMYKKAKDVQSVNKEQFFTISFTE